MENLAAFVKKKLGKEFGVNKAEYDEENKMYNFEIYFRNNKPSKFTIAGQAINDVKANCHAEDDEEAWDEVLNIVKHETYMAITKDFFAEHSEELIRKAHDKDAFRKLLRDTLYTFITLQEDSEKALGYKSTIIV